MFRSRYKPVYADAGGTCTFQSSQNAHIQLDTSFGMHRVIFSVLSRQFQTSKSVTALLKTPDETMAIVLSFKGLRQSFTEMFWLEVAFGCFQWYV